MTVRSTAGELERLQLSDDDTEDLWKTPSKRERLATYDAQSPEETIPPDSQELHDGVESSFNRDEAREAALQNELQTVRKINEVIEGLLHSIDCAKGNMAVSVVRT